MIDFAIENFKNYVDIIKENDNLALILSHQVFPDDYIVKLFLFKEKNDWYITDRGATKDILQEIYEVENKTFKKFFDKTIKQYGALYKKDMLYIPVENKNVLMQRFFEITTCISQLISMHIYFE